MSNRTAPHTPPAAPHRYRLALVSWAGAYGPGHGDRSSSARLVAAIHVSMRSSDQP